MIKLYRALALVCIFVLLCGSISVQAAPSQVQILDKIHLQDDEPCSSSQVILIIDQSRSMVRNDPNNLRFDVPLHVMDVLARNYITARLTANRLQRPLKVQLAVVQFASQAMIGMDWTTIAPVDDAAWVEQRQLISDNNLLTEDDYVTMYKTIINGTNFKDAFNIVTQLITKADPQVNGCPKRTYLLLTDGNPDRNGDPIKGSELKTYMEEVQETVDGNLLGEGNTLFVTGIKETTETTDTTDGNNTQDNYWIDTEQYWENITHEQERSNDQEPIRAEKVSSKAEIGYRLDEIINYQLNRGVVVAQEGENIIPPYLERVIFTFYKPDQANVMDLYDPQGVKVDEGPNVVFTGEDQGIQTIELIRPQPGRYRLVTTVQSGEYLITKDQFFIQASLESSANGLSQFGCHPIEIKLVDSNNQPIPDYGQEKYRLTVTANVTSDETGEVQPLSLSHEMANGLITGTFTPVHPGINHLSVTATALDDDQNKLDVLQSPFGDFDLQVDTLKLETGNVTNGSTIGFCAPAQYSTIELPMRFLDSATNQPTNMCIKPDFQVEGSNFSNISVGDPDGSGYYTLTGIPETSGNLNLIIHASGANPVTGQSVKIADANVSFNAEAGHKYEFTLVDMEIKPGQVKTNLNEFLLRLKSASLPDIFVIGQNFFKHPQVTISAKIREGVTPVNDSNLLLNVSLRSPSGQEFSNESWTPDSDTWKTAFKSLDLGCYQIIVKPPDNPAACGIEYLDVVQPIQNVCVVNVLGEWIAWAIIALIGLVVLIFILKILICKFWNPLSGWIAIIDQDNHTIWPTPLDGNSCWVFDLDENRHCNLSRLRICGVFKFNQNAILKIYKRDFNTNKIILFKKVNVQLKRGAWQDILIGGGCRIKWVENQNLLP